MDITPKPTEEVPNQKYEVQSGTHVIDNDGPGAYRIEVGIHTGKTSMRYTDAENGDVFLKYLAKKEVDHTDEAKKAAREYLEIRELIGMLTPPTPHGTCAAIAVRACTRSMNA